jgi:predicted N-acetyltransferase YhbS
MKLVRWKRFHWDLSKLSPPETALPAHFHIRSATREDARAVHDVIISSFTSDSSWSDAFSRFRERLEQQLEGAFLRATIPALVVTHGQRVIGASLLCTDADAESHLLSGPCVLNEYRNRGLGSLLLFHSLKALESSGLAQACGICKETAPTSKFVYRKFGSTSEPCQFDPAPLASR